MKKNRYDVSHESQKSSTPLWFITFADLMCLLMGFFVMLLSMSEFSSSRLAEVNASVRKAFGGSGQLEHQMEVPAMLPLIFSNGKIDGKLGAYDTDADVVLLKKTLKDELAKGRVELIHEGNVITLRIPESGVFQSGSADIKSDFHPVLSQVQKTLQTIPGNIIVSGYADNTPISTEKFRSNWELSAARAYSVIEDLLQGDEIPANRFVLQGFGETRPLAPNDSDENRAKNRRVEIMIDQRELSAGATVKEVHSPAPNLPIENKAAPEAPQGKI